MANQLPPGANATVQGTIDRVPCPHCSKPSDLRDLQSQQLLDTGHKLSCDHCHRMMEVTAIRTLTVVAVRRCAGMAKDAQGRPQYAQQQLPPQGGILGGVKRLLGGGPKR